jgi:hypothetical protein
MRKAADGGYAAAQSWLGRYRADVTKVFNDLHSNGKNNLASELASAIQRAQEDVTARGEGYVIVGRLVFDGKGANVRQVTAQMPILDEGYFAGEVNDFLRPVGFRHHRSLLSKLADFRSASTRD